MALRSSGVRWRRARLLAPVAAGALLVLGGCGGGSGRSSPTTHATAASTTPPTTAPTTSTSGAPSGLARCHTAQLHVSFGQLGAGAGQRYVQLVLTNAGAPCQTSGYIGMQLLGLGNQPIPTMVVRSTQNPVVTVTLASGAQASAQLHWAGIPLSDEPQTGPCEPNPTQAQVTPPNEVQFAVVPWMLGSVCGHGRIDADPLRAGVPSP
jgi:FtsP/CotA-like multicopper oxidase with cupredoxin domain